MVDVYLRGTELKKMSQLIGQFHDEFILRTKDTQEEKDKAKQIITSAINRLNSEVKLNVPLACGIQIGKKYSEIH